MEKQQTINNLDSLYVKFREQLDRLAKSDYIGVMYHQLFSLNKDEDMQKELEYLYTLYNGTDPYFKESSKECWFAIWHKSIRQTDYFRDCYQERKVDLISEDERKEYKFLLKKCKEDGFSKTKGKADNQLFNDTYNRYLYLYGRVKREKESVSINGELDSMLWNLIQIDKENELFNIFVKIFKSIE